MNFQFGDAVVFGEWKGLVMNPTDTFYFEDNGKPAVSVTISESPFGKGKLWVVDHPSGGQLGIFMGPGHEHPVVLTDRTLQKAPMPIVDSAHRDAFAGAVTIRPDAVPQSGGLVSRLLSWVPFVGR